MRGRLALILIGASALSGCSLLHSNIKGGFVCAAPHGTCAPSTTIDDDAIRAIGGPDVQTGDGGEESAATNSELTKPVKSVSTKFGTGKGAIFVPGGRPTIKVVFPAWRDNSGQVHPRTAAYTAVDLPPVPVAMAIPLNADQLGASESTSLLGVAEMAPDFGLLGSAPPAVAPAIDRTPEIGTKEAALVGGGSQAAGAGSTDPLGAIKDQVKHILSATKKAPAQTDAPKAGSTPDQTSASFPPKGS